MDGTPFGRYRLVEKIGEGGMGEVWRAYDSQMNRVVALKVLPAHFASDRTFQQRFRREAQSAAALDEPHVVPIYDFGEIDGRLFITMKLIKGDDLLTLLDSGPLKPRRAVKIIEQIASALHAAHEVGLVHRDVKPSNILVAQDDFAYLIDFGIARSAGQTGLTSTGMAVGTWAYMSPERLNTGTAEASADIYALTCVLHEALTGQRPFPGDSLEQQIVGHLTAPPPRPSTLVTGVSERMNRVIATGMAKSPDERYPTTRELAKSALAALRKATDNLDQEPRGSVSPNQQADAAAPTMAAPSAIAHTERQPPTVAAPVDAVPAMPLPYAPPAITKSGKQSPEAARKDRNLAIAVVGACVLFFAILFLIGWLKNLTTTSTPSDTSTTSAYSLPEPMPTGAPTVTSKNTGTVSKRDVQNQISAKMTDSNGNKPESVNCPGDLPANVGAQLNCEMTVHDEKYNVNVTVTSVVGKDAKFDMVETVDKDQVARIISDKLYQQVGSRPDAVICPDNLKGFTGATLRCKLTDGNSKYGVNVTVTTVVGGDVNFDFRVDDRPE